MASKYRVYNSSFSLPNVSLGVGTYWLLLDNCSPAASCGWGLSSQAAVARQYLNGVLDQGDIGTESFTLSYNAQVTPSGTPEPAGTFLAGGLFLAAMLAAHKRVYRPQ